MAAGSKTRIGKAASPKSKQGKNGDVKKTCGKTEKAVAAVQNTKDMAKKETLQKVKAGNADQTPERVTRPMRAEETDQKLPALAKTKGPAKASNRTAAQAFDDAQRFFLGQHGLMLALLEWPTGVTSTTLASAVRLEAPNDFLAMNHLLLPKTLMQNVIKTIDGMTAVTCTNGFWKKYLWPLAARARAHVAAKRFQDALGELLVFILFARDVDGWMCGEEPDSSRAAFAGFFDDLAHVWEKVMEVSDEKLGLKPSVGSLSGYRRTIHDLAAAAERDVNPSLEGCDAMSDDDEQLTPARIRLTLTGPSVEYLM